MNQSPQGESIRIDGDSIADQTAVDALEDLLSVAKEALASKRYEAAMALLREPAESELAHEELLYLLAVAQRYAGLNSDALKTLERLHRAAPSHGRSYQEEGHNLKVLGEPEAALRAYAWACHYNPALEASFRGQLQMLRQLDRPQAFGQVSEQLKQLRAMPEALVATVDLLSQGKVLKAEELCRRVLAQEPANVEAMRLLADIATRLGVLEDAEVLLASAHELAPGNVAIHIDYIQTLRKRQKFADARAQAQSLLASNPENPQFLSLAAVEAMQSGDYDEALGLFDGVLERLPGDSVTLTSIGHAEKTRGNYDDAVSAYHSALRSNPSHGEAFYSLANLKVYRFDDREVASMREAVADPRLPHNDRVYLNFALGKAFEDRKDFGSSFSHYEQGNALKKAQSRYRSSAMSEDLAAQQSACTPALFEKFAGAGCDAKDPIFILGLPRAGSTLVEQILASHSQVDGTLELPNILSLSQRLRRLSRLGKARAGEGMEYADYPANLHQLEAAQLREFGEEFIEQTAIHRAGAPFFIDKMPNNFRHIGLIKLILPNAKIIDARRGAMACCFSGFKQLFAEGQEFSYSLADVGSYYRDYVHLMAHWDRVLPGFVHRIENEALIEDLEGEVAKLLEFCGLPFEQSCVDFHRNKRNVRTPSSEQVRQPVNKSGVDQWRSYSAFLDPLRTALGDLAQE